MNQGNCKSDFRVVKDGSAGGGEEAGEAAGDKKQEFSSNEIEV